MEDIKVGEWVRTKRGEICKVLGISPEVRNETRLYSHKHYYLDNKKGSLTRFYITKHNFNLIDLLEVKDIVVMLDTKFNTKDYIFIDDKEMLKAVKEDLKDRCKLLEVLTHEQFEANCYKIKQK